MPMKTADIAVIKNGLLQMCEDKAPYSFLTNDDH